MQEEAKKELSPREVKHLERERLLEERANAERALKHEYSLISDTAAFLDLLNKIKGISDYHQKIAKDGVGFKQEPGGESSSLVVLEPHERLRELDKSAGIDEISDYIERKLDSKP